MPVKPIPSGFHAITPHLTVKGCAKALDYYKKAFGAVERMRMPTPDGSIMHASITIGDSIIMLNDENPQWNAIGPATLGGSPVTIHLYVEDVDRAFKKAIDAGATAVMPVTDMFWGDRYGVLTDPFGHVWSIATHTHDFTPAQMQERAASAMCPST